MTTNELFSSVLFIVLILANNRPTLRRDRETKYQLHCADADLLFPVTSIVSCEAVLLEFTRPNGKFKFNFLSLVISGP